MLPRYVYVCRVCGHTVTLRSLNAPTCCEVPMGRDWKAEAAQAAYHPSKGNRHTSSD